jgi:membrane peptidoglycan carboxypeptidase
VQTPPQRVTRQGRPRNGPARPTTAGWLGLIVFFFLAGIGAIGALATVSLYTALASNLDPVENLLDYELPEESIVYDRNGTELARFGDFKREVVTFEEIPPVLLDATTAIEDKTFWENAGFDPVAIFSAGLDSIRGRSRGASTVTQQLTRMRLLDPDLLEDSSRLAERKLKEIIQSIRLTQHFEGEQGKQDIITAYLNQIYYGNQSYGVKAAARSYFGVSDLNELTPAQAAILAALPKSPSNYDLVRNAVEECIEPGEAEGECAESQLVVPADSTVVQRRNQILTLMAEDDRTPMSDGQYTDEELLAARDEPVLLVRQTTARWLAPHFVWRVRDELATKLCGEDATCPQLDQGGLRITTTLDLDMQRVAEKWVKAAAVVPFSNNPRRAAERLGLEYESWMSNLSDKRLRNGALVAIDYQTGELVAYVGSADYYATRSTKRFQPKYDVAGQGYRQPGSAFKPFNYAIGIDSGALTAGSVLMDVGTDFGNDYTPNDADRLERGPVTVRGALQFSLNIPSVKAMEINQPANVFARAQEFGMRFRGDSSQTGLSLALGTQETPPVDLVTSYATLANQGRYIGHTTILTVQDRAGTDVIKPYQPPEPVQVVSPRAAWVVTDILAGNTNRSINPYWGEFRLVGPEDRRRPATLKTGTNNDAKDLNAYGYIAAPTRAQREAGAYALAVGAWNGNSDNSEVSTANNPLFSIDVTTYVWQGFLQEVTAEWPVRSFARPEEGLTQVAIDPFTGLLARSGQENVEEWFLTGTEPTTRLPADACGPSVLRLLAYESRFDNWMEADEDWLRRARRGPGTVGGPDRTRVTYFYNNSFQPHGRTWGPLMGRGCAEPTPAPTCVPLPTPDASGVIPSFELPTPSGDAPALVFCSPEPPTPSPSAEPSEEPTPEPEPTPTPEPEPTPTPTPTPTPEPTPTPTPEAVSSSPP